MVTDSTLTSSIKNADNVPKNPGMESSNMGQMEATGVDGDDVKSEAVAEIPGVDGLGEVKINKKCPMCGRRLGR